MSHEIQKTNKVGQRWSLSVLNVYCYHVNKKQTVYNINQCEIEKPFLK